ncbi:MAG TPA: RluA family pseudouridine synthase [Verrucomicrobiae bacterium]|nr:RluA family pseudouridine synthase [Verrucomicrobiae bacterium]
MLNVIHEDADLLVVNKPAGLVCHPTKNGEMSSLIGRARLYLNGSSRREPAHFSETENEGEPASIVSPHLINRLDRETSGVTLIAKNPAAAGELGKIFENRAVQKEYLAIVHGRVRENHGLIDAPLGKDERSIVAVKDCVRADGAAAQTEFFIEQKFLRNGENFSLLRLLPRTGRKHQIRIHLAHLGHPIVGDKLYGGDEDCYLALAQNRLTDAQRAKLILENHALHACSLKFIWRGKDVEFSCQPEKGFMEFLSSDSEGGVPRRPD